MSDTIDRQAAIEIVDRYDKSHMILKGKPMLGAASIVIELEALPSAQPEIVRCANCKWFDISELSGTVEPIGYKCKRRQRFVDADDFCKYGERLE